MPCSALALACRVLQNAMGMGSVNLIVIDTDGSYTDHDVFKITKENGAALLRDLRTTSFDQISAHPHILLHARCLTLEGLASECQTCPVVDACGGGSVMHRWHSQRQLDAPSVYCGELFDVIETATRLLRSSLRKSNRSDGVYLFPLTGEALVDACRVWRKRTETLADNVALRAGFNRDGIPAAAVLLSGRSTNTVISLYRLNLVQARNLGSKLCAFNRASLGWSTHL